MLHRIWITFDARLARFGDYAVSDVSQEEYAGTADANLREVEEAHNKDEIVEWGYRQARRGT